MRKKHFTHIKVGRDINVSSSQNYTINVWFDEDGVHKSYWYDPQIGLESKSENHFTRNVPKYVTQEIDATLRLAYLNGNLRFYEVNQDGDERYEGLRYHDEAYFARLIDAESEPK